jgi:DNA-binding response OmpR family regulator
MNTAVPPTLLVVDDESHMRRLLHFSLSKTGAKILLAANGREALAQAHAQTVDLVVIDFIMPDLDGFATLRELRRDPRYAKLPVIMLTSRGQTELRDVAEEVGVDVFLTKPFSPLELTRHVKRLLGRTEATGVPFGSG